MSAKDSEDDGGTFPYAAGFVEGFCRIRVGWRLFANGRGGRGERISIRADPRCGERDFLDPREWEIAGEVFAGNNRSRVCVPGL
jgi:hypothetical protein